MPALSPRQVQKPEEGFTSVMDRLGQLLGLTVSHTQMPISHFKASYNELLRAANKGKIQQISRGQERYVLLTEDQVLALLQTGTRPRSLAASLSSITRPTSQLDESLVELPGSLNDPFAWNESTS